MIAFRVNPKICTKALHGKPGICRCVRCRPDLHLPASDAHGPASDAAARHFPPPGGGNPPPSDGACLAGAPLDPAADRSLPLSGNPVGGLCLHPERSSDQ
jgi:hypothetical protein